MNRCDVAVIGAGPVGLTLLTALRRDGIDAVAFDSGPGPTSYPKSRLVSARSMEIFRRLDLAAEVEAASLDAQWCQRLVVRRSVTGPELARIERPPRPEAPRAFEAPALCTQDALEHCLAANLDDRFPGAVRWRSTVARIEPDEAGVTVCVRGRDSAEQTWRALYAVCADGIRGISGTLPGAGRRLVFGRQVSIRVCIALSRWTVPAFICYLVDRGLSAQLLVVDGRDDWIVSSLARKGETALDYGPERARALLAAVTGLPETGPVIGAARITGVRMWELATRVGDSFRAGRVIRAGDAAHEILPTGAMGLNLGIADVDALAWRLRAVLEGAAGPEVLDDYDRVRRAAAMRTPAWSRANLNAVALMLGAAARHDDPAFDDAAAALAAYLDTSGLEADPSENLTALG